MIPNILTLLTEFFKQRIFLDKYEKKFIKFNELKWAKPSEKLHKEKSKSIILVDLFPWYPLIYFWSYLTNIFSRKYDCDIKYYYFNFSETKSSNFSAFISKLEDIYKSFNVTKGISEYDFHYTRGEINMYEKNFYKIKNKKNLVEYRKKNIKIGDLIYDSYLRTTLNPTLNIYDKKLKRIFFRAEKIFDEVNSFFKTNDIKCVIPSHLCYVSYGIIARIAISKNIPVIKVRSEKWGQKSFRLIYVDKWCLDESPYYSYKKKFKKFSKKEKIKNLAIGKKIIKSRISGNKDNYLKYLEKSQFHKSFKKINFFKKPTKQKIIIFPHCFYDYPHRFRWMIFNDFYEHANYFLEKSLQLKQYEWFYKPHPHSLKGHVDIHKEILKKYPNVIYLNKDTSHRQIIKMRPKCIVTNHGTVAHEYAYFNIPSINTGDNPHINYKFCITVRTIKKLDLIMNNLDHFLKNFKIEKKEIYEYLFMHYDYFINRFNEKDLIDDSFFSSSNSSLNKSSYILKYLIQVDKNNNKKIADYIKNFLKHYKNSYYR
jgi:hypothetical protein